MREIKFRAWEKPDKKVKFDGAMHYDIVGNDYFGNWLNSDDYEIMQYTGLKDKNGKEIYEGDIVKHDDGNDTIETSVIKWTHSYKPGFEFPCQAEEHLEVIGNIYENPDLLISPPLSR